MHFPTPEEFEDAARFHREQDILLEQFPDFQRVPYRAPMRAPRWRLSVRRGFGGGWRYVFGVKLARRTVIVELGWFSVRLDRAPF